MVNSNLMMLTVEWVYSVILIKCAWHEYVCQVRESDGGYIMFEPHTKATLPLRGVNTYIFFLLPQ